MLNYIWLGFILVAVLVGGFTGRLPEMTTGAFDQASSAVMTLALPLIGIMAIWLGIMRLAERSGLVQVIARVLRPLMRWLFPEVPPDHPAIGAIVMTMSANMLGLNNAATPLGLRAMSLLEKLNPRPGIASNAMCTFLAISTASIQIVPTTAIGILAVNHAADPTSIVLPAFLATLVAACSGVAMAKFLEKLPMFRLPAVPPNLKAATIAQATDAKASSGEDTPNTAASPSASPEVDEATQEAAPLPAWGAAVLIAFLLCFGWMWARLVWFAPLPAQADKPVWLRLLLSLSVLAVPFMLSFFPLYAALRKVKVYEQFVEGAKEAFGVGVRIIPFLVAMLVAIRLLRDSGVIKIVTDALAPVLGAVHFPPELLPMVIMRPLSGSGTQGIFVELVQHFGGDHLISRMAGTIFGSTETTFYVLTVYFGSVAVRQTRHAVLAGLTADTVAVIVSITLCRLLFS